MPHVTWTNQQTGDVGTIEVPDHYANNAAYITPPLWANPVAYEQAMATKLKGDLSSSQKNDSHQNLRDHLIELSAWIDQEMGELDSVRSELQTQAEVLAEIGSRVRTHISSLQTVATLHGKRKLTAPPLYPHPPGQEQAGFAATPAEAGQIAEAVEAQAEPELFEQDQE